MICSRCGKEVTEDNCATRTIEGNEEHIYLFKRSFNGGTPKRFFCIDCGIDKLEEVLIFKKIANEKECGLCLERFKNVQKDRTYRG